MKKNSITLTPLRNAIKIGQVGVIPYKNFQWESSVFRHRRGESHGNIHGLFLITPTVALVQLH